MVNAPVAFSDTHVAWHEASGASFLGTITMASGPILSLDLSQTPRELVVRRAAIEDRGTSAIITLRQNDTFTDVSFSGRLAQSSLSRIFKHGTFGKGTMEGDLRVAVRTDRPADSTAQGRLVGRDLVIPWGLAVPIRVDNVSLHADRNILTVDSAALTWGKDHYTIHGDVSASDAGLVLDMDLGADTIAVETIQQALARDEQGKRRSTAAAFPHASFARSRQCSRSVPCVRPVYLQPCAGCCFLESSSSEPGIHRGKDLRPLPERNTRLFRRGHSF